MFQERRERRDRNARCQAAATVAQWYVNGTPLWDPGVRRTVTRRLTFHQLPAGLRVGCEVLLHDGHNLTPGQFNAEWTVGLLNELRGVYERRGYLVEGVTNGDGALVALRVLV